MRGGRTVGGCVYVMTQLDPQQIDAMFQIIMSRFERKGPVNFSKDDVKDKMIRTIDRDISKTVDDIKKKIIKSVQDQVTDEDVGFIIKEIIDFKLENDIPIPDSS